jgi:hypothetical protein
MLIGAGLFNVGTNQENHIHVAADNGNNTSEWWIDVSGLGD